MSYDYMSSWAYTEDERACGLPGLVEGYGRYGHEQEEENSFEEYDSEFEEDILVDEYSSEVHDKKVLLSQEETDPILEEIEWIKKVKQVKPHLLNHILNEKKYKNYMDQKRDLIDMVSEGEFKHSVLKYYLKNYINDMVQQYNKIEKIQTSYLNIIYNKKCLLILIKNILKNNQIILTEDIYMELKKLDEEVHNNKKVDIVYDRVYKVQQFIHNTIEHYNGKNSQFKLNKKMMKALLSTIRLHLSIYDLKTNKVDKILEIYKKTKKRIRKEYENPTRNGVLPYKRFIPYWKLSKMKPLLDFATEKKLILNLIILSDSDISEDEVIEKVLYADNDFINKLQSYNF